MTPKEISARKGDPRTIDIRENVYTDLESISSNKATGNSTPIDVTIPI